MSGALRTWTRLAAAGMILAVLVWRLGTGPVLDGVRRVDGWALAVALTVTAATTVLSAWRWRLVSRGLGVDLPLRTAVPAYYRSQLLNSTLPGGVVGDVHRGVSHGRDTGDLSGGIRAVAWERTAGQVVQVAITVVVLVVLPSPVHRAAPLVAATLAVLAGTVALWVRTHPGEGRSQVARVTRTMRSDLRDGVLARGTWPGVVLASALVVVGHTTAFVVAARTAGVTAPLPRLVPLALLVMAAMSVPTGIGGWGPREGVAAAAFAAAGLGAATGLATAVVYGVMVTVSTLPGLLVLAAGARRPRASVRRVGVPLLAAGGGGG
jgi:glycosyltransferase 2 family protein